MSKDIHLNKSIRLKQEARNIAREVLNFGVNEDQKFDIIYLLSISLEDNNAMREITSLLKKYKSTINNEEDNNNIIENENKILTS